MTKKNISKRKRKNDISDDDCESDDDCDDELRVNFNKIYFIQDVNIKSAARLIKILQNVQEKLLIQSIQYNCEPLHIELFISSNGGDIHAAFSVIDFIMSMTINVHSIVSGLAASAATLISISCHRRFIEPNAFMLIHELRGEVWGKMSTITDEYNNLKKIMKKIILLYNETTYISKYELLKILQKDIILDAQECINKGLVDMLW